MILLLLICFIIIPYLVGKPIRKVLDHMGHDMVTTYLCGVMMIFIASGSVQLLLVLKQRPFSEYEKLFPAVLAVLGFAGLLLLVWELCRKKQAVLDFKKKTPESGRFRFKDRESRIFSVLTAAVLALCVVRILTGAPDVTGDFTLETVNTTLDTDSIYQYNSLTGIIVEEGMPIRQQILTLPFFLAFLSDVFRMDATVLLYQFFPCYVLLLTALVYSRWGRLVFSGQSGRQKGFVFIVSLLIFVGDYARLSPAALLLHQGFTGNAVCAGVVIPFAIYLCMREKWLLVLLCIGAELFLIWTTYGLGFCVCVLLLFALLRLGRFIGHKRK